MSAAVRFRLGEALTPGDEGRWVVVVEEVGGDVLGQYVTPSKEDADAFVARAFAQIQDLDPSATVGRSRP